MTHTTTNSPTESSSQRPLRRDAERNRVHVLEAAAELFALHGTDVSTAEIARHAGVGNGTIFRRYPTKADLVVAVVSSRHDMLERAVDASLACTDPWRGFEQFMRDALALHVDNHALLDAVMGTHADHPAMQKVHERVTATMARVLERAQAAGVVPRDLTAGDLPMLLCALVSTAHGCDNQPDDAQERYLDYLLAGLRACAPSSTVR